mmetsp:Transcript_11650/g.19888  ORF Transcript_11650/g.19888 Transcript_11650/m.19888 type:complete len:273 (-) Transcript_11650:1236-2054(-)
MLWPNTLAACLASRMAHIAAVETAAPTPYWSAVSRKSSGTCLWLSGVHATRSSRSPWRLSFAYNLAGFLYSSPASWTTVSPRLSYRCDTGSLSYTRSTSPARISWPRTPSNSNDSIHSGCTVPRFVRDRRTFEPTQSLTYGSERPWPPPDLRPLPLIRRTVMEPRSFNGSGPSPGAPCSSTSPLPASGMRRNLTSRRFACHPASRSASSLGASCSCGGGSGIYLDAAFTPPGMASSMAAIGMNITVALTDNQYPIAASDDCKVPITLAMQLC